MPSQEDGTAMIEWVSFVAMVLLIGGCDVDIPVEGDGQKTTDSRSLGGFTAVENRSSVDVTVTQQASFSVVVTGDSNLLGMVKTTVNGNTLTISTDDPFDTHIGVFVSVGLPVITGLSNDGSGQLSALSVSTGNLTLESAGSGRVSLQGTTSQLVLTSSGSGGVVLTGAGSDLEATLLGSGRTDASAFIADGAKVALSGSGGLLLTVHGNSTLEDDGSGSITAVLSGGSTCFAVHGSGSIAWLGETTVTSEVVTGSGTIIEQ
jgi:hypothetical protein